MGKPISRTVSFFTFDLPLNAAFNRLALLQVYKQYSSIGYWSIDGTKQRLISAYWYKYVLRHFAIFIVVAASMYLSMDHRFTPIGFSILFLMLGILYVVLFLTIYRPLYSNICLPQINSLVDRWVKAEEEKKAAAEAKNIPPAPVEQTKSTRTQTKIPALTIIHSVLFQAAGIKTLACDDKSAKLINTLTGVDTGSIKENLRRIYKPSDLSVKERAERRKAIDIAEGYFAELNHNAALQILVQLRKKYDRD